MNLFQRYKKYTYSSRISFSLLFSLLIAGPVSRAQHNNVLLTGKVYDERTKDPLPAAVMRIKGTTHSVVTDNNGAFTLAVKPCAWGDEAMTRGKTLAWFLAMRLKILILITLQ